MTGQAKALTNLFTKGSGLARSGLATKYFGGERSVGGVLAIAGLNIASGHIMGALVDRQKQYEKSYYGEVKTDIYDTLKKGLIFGGYFNSALSFLGVDPITRLIKTPSDLMRLGPNQILNKIGFTKKLSTSKKIRLYGGPLSPYSPNTIKAGTNVSNFKVLHNQKRPGIDSKALIRLGISTVGTAVPIGALLAEHQYGGVIAGTTVALGGAAALGGVIGLGGFAGMVAKMGFGNSVTAGATAFGVGAVLGLESRVSPAAEGNITSVSSSSQSAVSKMNFSTAGLVQALHRNRKGE